MNSLMACSWRDNALDMAYDTRQLIHVLNRVSFQRRLDELFDRHIALLFQSLVLFALQIIVLLLPFQFIHILFLDLIEFLLKLGFLIFGFLLVFLLFDRVLFFLLETDTHLGECLRNPVADVLPFQTEAMEMRVFLFFVVRWVPHWKVEEVVVMMVAVMMCWWVSYGF